MKREKILYRVILFGLGLLLAASVAVAGPPPFTTTTLVPGNGTALANGTNLLNAIAAATPPALVKVEPGVYDLGGQQIVMRDLVDIEGSGRDVTTIVSDVSSAATPAVVRVPAGVEAELRDLTVRNVSGTSISGSSLSAGNGYGVEVSTSEFLMTEVNVEIDVTATGIGVLTRDSSPRLNEVFVRIEDAKEGIGYDIDGGGTVITQSLAFVAVAEGKNIGVRAQESTAILDTVVSFALFGETNIAVQASGDGFEIRVENTRGTASGGSAAYGLFLGKGAEAIVKDSTFRVENDVLAVGLQVDNGFARTTESTFLAGFETVAHSSVFAARMVNASQLRANQSNYESTSVGVSNTGTGVARFGAGQLVGTAISSGFFTLRCVSVYDGAYNARPGSC